MTIYKNILQKKDLNLIATLDGAAAYKDADYDGIYQE